jgi:selenocysteine lyase/cysteine desulfurase
MLSLEEAQRLWSPQPGWLNTATYGLPPDPAWDAMQAALADWRVGRTSWEHWCEATERARQSYARMIGVDAADVAIGAQVSQLLAPIAATLTDRTTVLVPELEFTSNLFPWLVSGATVRTAPAGQLAEHIDSSVDLVAFGLVQSVDGEVTDYAAIVDAAKAVGATVVVDASQACGWLPFDGSLADAVVTAAYKWLMSPRGTSFIYLSGEFRDRLRPLAAGWYAGDDPFASFYGLPLRLAKDARAFDISPAWHPWVGTAPAMELIERIGVATINSHNVTLANRLLTGLGRPQGNSAIVTVQVPDAQRKLSEAGIRAATRGGRVRASCHVYNTEADVDAAIEALTRS